MWRKLIPGLILSIWLFSADANAAKPAVSFGEAVFKDNSVTFPIIIRESKNTAFTSMGIDIVFDANAFDTIPAVAQLDAEPKSHAKKGASAEKANKNIRHHVESGYQQGRLRLLITDNDNELDDGEVVYVTFPLKPGAQAGDYPFTISCSGSDKNGAMHNFPVNNLTVRVPGR